MDHRANRKCKSALVTLAVMLFVIAETALGQSTAFSYQGRLTDASNPANGSFDIQFKLFNTLDAGTGTQQGPTITNSTVQVTNGVFSVQLDYGNVFDGSARYLEISLRPAGSPNPRTVLSPRQPLTSTPYAVRSLTASNAIQFSGLNPSSFLQFNGSGNVGIGTTTPQTKLEVLTATNSYGFTHTDGTIRFGSYVNGLSAPPGGWFGTQSNHPLYFFTNGQARLTISTDGNVGIGTTNPLSKLTVQTASGSPGFTQTDGSVVVGSHISFGNARFGTNTNHSFDLMTNGLPRMNVDTIGNVGIGSFAAPVRLFVSGGPAWTSYAWLGSLGFQNAAAIGWAANAAGKRFGIGHSTGGFYFFRTDEDFGNTANPPNYDMIINDAGAVGVTGDLGVGGNATQNREKGGFAKAMLYVNGDGTILRCYNGQTGSSSGGCGFSVTHPFSGYYNVNFGFQIDDRFYSVAVNNNPQPYTSVTFAVLNSSTLQINTFRLEPGVSSDRPFMLIVY